MPPTTPRCVYCSKPTRSHELAIPAATYASALDDEAIDADFGVHWAAVCHECWDDHVPPALAELSTTDSTGEREIDRATQEAIRAMDHRHVRFDPG